MTPSTPGPSVRSVVRETNLSATMPDGTELVADLWRPEGPGRWPVLLQRIPYGRSVASSIVLPHPMHLAARGYVVVAQDVRGRGDSGGTFRPYVDEGADGASSIEWAAGLACSDGRVATYGFSYQGLNQVLAAGHRPESLHAIAPMQCGPNPGNGWTFENGCLKWDFVATWAAQLAEGRKIPPTASLTTLPTTEALGPNPPEWFGDWLGRSPDDPLWTSHTPGPPADDLPVFTVGGWHDLFAAATGEMATALDAELVFGPWSHIPWSSTHATGDFGPAAGPARAYERFLSFLDRVFRGADGPAMPVDYFTIGDGWRSSPIWPVEAKRQTWFASGDHANSRYGDGRLSSDPSPLSSTNVIVAEPLRPLPGDLTAMTDERLAEDRRDILCFTSPSFEHPIVVTGSVAVTVVTKADQPTHDVIASLVAVAPDGSAIRMATGAHRLERADPGTWRTTSLTLHPTSWLVEPGWRIRLDISASRFPAYDRNPQCDISAQLATHQDVRVATIEVSDVTVDLPVE